MCGGSELTAGGFLLDPQNCPTGNWLPEPDIPQTVTDTLCDFLLALDDGEESAAYKLLSKGFSSRMSFKEFKGAFSDLQQSGSYYSREPPERYVMNVSKRGDAYRFSIQVFGGSRGYEEDILIREDQIVGLRIGN
jgi:hypothetical protein